MKLGSPVCGVIRWRGYVGEQVDILIVCDWPHLQNQESFRLGSTLEPCWRVSHSAVLEDGAALAALKGLYLSFQLFWNW